MGKKEEERNKKFKNKGKKERRETEQLRASLGIPALC